MAFQSLWLFLCSRRTVCINAAQQVFLQSECILSLAVVKLHIQRLALS